MTKVRCPECDKWGWVRDPANRYGPEIPCPECDGVGTIEERDVQTYPDVDASH